MVIKNKSHLRKRFINKLSSNKLGNVIIYRFTGLYMIILIENFHRYWSAKNPQTRTFKHGGMAYLSF